MQRSPARYIGLNIDTGIYIQYYTKYWVPADYDYADMKKLVDGVLWCF